MTFANPEWIAVLIVPVTLLFWEWVRRGHPLVMPFDDLNRHRGWLLRGIVLAANSLPAVLLAIALVLLARPVTFAPPKTQRLLSNIQIVLDCSLSMREAYGAQTSEEAYTRFDGAMDAIDAFVSAREGDAFGLTVFSRNFLHWVPLTQDVDAIRRARPFIAPENFPDPIWGGTYIANALEGSLAPLARHEDGDRLVILITDGESRDLSGETLRRIVSKLKQANIVVFAISMTDSPIAPGLTDVTRQTGGAVFQAVTPETLAIVFRSIDKMKKVELRSVRAEVIDAYEPLISPTSVLLALQMLVLFGLRFTPW
jgi:Ca-activated chloride channel family protein